MVTYKVDLDYESSLFDPHYNEDSRSSLKMVREFEYVFFLSESSECALKNYKQYDLSYLSRIQKLGFTVPEFNPGALLFKKWWSHDHDLELEKKLNSKITSADLALQHGWGFREGALVQNLNDVEVHLEKFHGVGQWMLKDPFSFSGRGHLIFERDHMLKLKDKINGRMLLEPVYDRLFDIGTTVVIQNGVIKNHFMVENTISKKGGFRGGIGSYDVEKFKKYIEKKYSYSLEELESLAVQIAMKYIQLGAQFNVQIDSFVYREKGELRPYALVEVNYRKTMGLVIQCLAQKFSSSDIISWVLSTEKKAESSSIIRLSPDDSHFHSYLELH